MSFSLIAFATIAAILLLALGWLAFSNWRKTPELGLGPRQERDWTHITYLPYIKQALARADIEFLKQRGSPALAKRIRKERQQISLTYLTALKREFEKLLDVARLLAVMSPEVKPVRELQGVRLQMEFSYRYYLIYCRLLLGIAPLEAIGNLSDMVSALTVQMEAAMSQLGERAALPT